MKKKLLLTVLIIFLFQKLYSQEIYFQSGFNTTRYDYKNSQGTANDNIDKGMGMFYEIGYLSYLTKKINYSIGVSLNEYNAVGGNTVNNYRWDTRYIGVNNRLIYLFASFNDFECSTSAGLGLSTILSGNQKIDGETHNLVSNSEFSGLIIVPAIGLEIKTIITGSTFLSLGYNFTKSLRLSNTSDEKLSFNTHQISFGVHLFIR